ncbi:MAG: exopolysaccharide biosynthesis protein [Oleiphilaceae bacterium]|nr:exopolysaccharide biosynthesis protein [Oleiphilaceae bacterium]
MCEPQQPANLDQMLDRLEEAERFGGTHTTMEDIVSKVGRRSFGPLLLVPGLITLMPVIGDIPGVPTLMALLVLIVAGQLLVGRDYFWLPNTILKRSVPHDKLEKAVKWSRRPARFMDRFLKPRLVSFTRGPGVHVIALVCILIALVMPPMEVVPFTANGAGLALTLFGLSLMAKDGLLALIGLILTAVTFGLVFSALV